MPNDPSGLNQKLWQPAPADPSGSAKHGGKWFYNATDKAWLRYDANDKAGRNGKPWHFFRTNPGGPPTSGGLPKPQNEVKVNGDRHLGGGDDPKGFRNNFSGSERVRDVFQKVHDFFDGLPRPPLVAGMLKAAGSHLRGKAVNVSGWATIFFGELSSRLGRTVTYAPDGAGNFDSTEPELRVLGSDDTFMSVWTNAGIAWDGPATQEAAVEAAAEVRELIARREQS